MAAGDVSTLAPDAVHSPRLHPHLVAFVKWCVLRAWGAAGVLLGRLLALPPPLSPLAALVHSTLLRRARRRRPSTAAAAVSPAPHISAHATVACEVLHAPPPPAAIAVDVIFVHGLYGSLANTWRQGQWRSKRKSELNKIPLKRPASESQEKCSCLTKEVRLCAGLNKSSKDQSCQCNNVNDDKVNKTRKHNLSRNRDYEMVNGKDDTNKIVDERVEESKNYKIESTNRTQSIDDDSIHRNVNNYECAKEGSMFDQIYETNDNTYILSNVKIVENYSDYVNDIFINQTRNNFTIFENGCDNIDMIFSSISSDGANLQNENGDGICDDLASKAKDYCMLRKDKENINNIHSDNTRLGDESNMEINGSSTIFNYENLQESPIINVTFDNNDNKNEHRTEDFFKKEGLGDKTDMVMNNSSTIFNYENLQEKPKVNATFDDDERTEDRSEDNFEKSQNDDTGKVIEDSSRACEVGCGCVCSRCYSACWPRDWLQVDYPDARVISINYTSDPYLWRPIWIKEGKRLRLHERAEQMMAQLLELGVGSRPIVWVGHSKGGLFIKQIYAEAYEAYVRDVSADMASLWSRSAGFMFYSVPHRGSPLADINIPPLVARSIELLEMGKDCSEVLGLQERWLRAAGGAGGAPVVRSLVETCRTLMAVLWLRIVSVESADAGIGALCGVPVDHREICKPSGRACPLYRELLHVVDSALGRGPGCPPARRTPARPRCTCH